MINYKPTFMRFFLIIILILFNFSVLIFADTIQINKNTDISTGKIYGGNVNFVVMSLNLTLSGGSAVADTITQFAIKNNGTMVNSTDVSKLSLWYDAGTTNYWDAGDTKIGDLSWNGVSSMWDTANCAIPLFPSVTTKIIITITIDTNSVIGRTFNAQIPKEMIVCLSGDTGPASNLINSGTQTVSLLQLEMEKLEDIASGYIYPSSANNTVMALSISGAANVTDTVVLFSLKNLGNMDNNDVDTVSLWYDSNGNNQWNSGDVYINSLTWQGSGVWSSNSVNIVMTSGSAKVLVTVTMKSGLTVGDTLQLQIITGSCSASIAGTGPVTSITNSGIKTASAGKKWTFMVYLDGDNNLEEDGVTDFTEMASVGSNDDFNIVVQFDRITGYSTLHGDWKNTQRFYVTAGMDPTTANAISDWGDGSGGGREVNMADTQVFVDFLNWTKNNYPADSYVLVMWNHGGGWRSRSAGSSQRNKAVVWDESTAGEPRIRMSDMRRAIEQTGMKFDIIGFDVCLAGMIEVAYELKDLAKVVVASPLTEPGGGWPYTEILTYLKNNPTTTSAAFGSTIVDEYNNSYPSGPVTQSAYNIGNINTFTALIDDFSEKLMAANIWADIKTQRTAMVESSDPITGTLGEMDDGDDGTNSANTGIDLKAFAAALSGKEANLTTSITNLSNGFSNFIINFKSRDTSNHNGLAIFFPRLINNPTHKYSMKFGQASKWDEFLRMYWSNETGKGPYNLSMTPLSDSSITGNYYVGWSGAKDANGINKYRLKEYKDAQILFIDNAENGLSGWTNTGFSVTDRYKNSGTYSFASGEGYSTTKKITKSISLPAGKNYLLTYWIYNDAGGDAVSVKVNSSSKKSYSVNTISEPLETVDLSSYAGQTITLEFSVVFDNSLGWDGEGVFIDDINIWSYVSVSTVADTISSASDSIYLTGKTPDAYMYTIAASDGTNWSNEYGFDTTVVVGLNIDTLGIIVSDSIMRTQQNITVSGVSVKTGLSSDVLTKFSVKNLGSVSSSDIDNMKLWFDSDNNSQYSTGDTYIGILSWNAGLSQWDTQSAVIRLVSGSANLIVTIDVNSIADVGETFQAQVPVNGITSQSLGDGPSTVKTEKAVKTVINLNFSLTKMYDAPTAKILPGAQNVTVLSVRATGSNPVDTITQFALKNIGNMNNVQIDSVALWFDANGNLTYDAADTYIGLLGWNAGLSCWDTGISGTSKIVLTSGAANIIVTICVDTPAAVQGDSFQANIEINCCTAELSGFGPSTAILNSGIKTVSTGKAWTFMVYMDADNDLEPSILADLVEMYSVGSNDDLNIVAQMDRITGYDGTSGDWINTQRFYVTSGLTPTTENAISDWGDGSGGREVNMADSMVMVDFVNWAISNYPAEKYALVVSNHGGGWRSKRSAADKSSKTRALIWDDSADGAPGMKMPDFRRALEKIGKKFDLIGFDVCLAGMAEVAYEIKDYAEVIVASQRTEPGSGYPYDAILTTLKTNAQTYTAEQLGTLIVDEYYNSTSGDNSTQAAYRTSRMSNLKTAIDNFADAICSANIWSEIRTARETIASNANGENEEMDDGDDDGDNSGIDLYHFAELLSATSNAGVNSAASNLKNEISQFLIRFKKHYTTSDYANPGPDWNGIAIFLPNENYNPVHDKAIAFGRDSSWTKFLRYYRTSMDGSGAGEPIELIMNPIQDLVADAAVTVEWYSAYDGNGLLNYRLTQFKGVDLLFSENFENGIGNWTNSGFGLTTLYKMSGSSYSLSSGTGYNTDNSITLTNSISLPAGKNIMLTYWNYNDFAYDGSNFYDSGTIQVSTDNGASWTGVKSIVTGKYVSEDYDAVDISAYSGQNIKVKIVFKTDNVLGWDGEGMFLDDIKIWSYTDKTTVADTIGNGTLLFTVTDLSNDTYMFTLEAEDVNNNMSNPVGYDTVVVLVALDTPIINSVLINNHTGGIYAIDSPVITADSSTNSGTVYFNGNTSNTLKLLVNWQSVSTMKSINSEDIFGNGILTDTTSADSWILNFSNVTGRYDTYAVISAVNYQNRVDTVLINFIADTYSPAVSLITPADTYYSNVSGIYFNWNNASDDKSGTKYYLLQISTVSNFSVIDSSVILTDTTGYYGSFSEGIYYWRVKLADRVNNLSSDTESVSRIFSVDMTKPVISGIYVYTVNQADSGYLYRNGLLSSLEEDTIWLNSNFSISERMDIVWTDLNKDSVAGSNIFGTAPVDTSSADSWILNYTSNVKFGDTIIIVSAYDKNGNTDTAKINFREDISAPSTPVLTSPANMTYINSDTNLVWNQSSDTQSGFKHYKLEIFDTYAVNQSEPIYSVITSSLSVQLPVYSLEANTYCWRVIAYDNVNNFDTSVAYNTFVIQNKVPVITNIILTSSQMNNLAFAGRINQDYKLNVDEDTVYYSNFASSSNITLNFCITWSNGDTIYYDTLYYNSGFATSSGYVTDTSTSTTQSNTITYTITRNVNYPDTKIIIAVYDKTDGDSDFAVINIAADTKVDNVTLVYPTDDYCTSNLKPLFKWNSVTSEKYGVSGYYLKICSNTQFKTFEQSVFTTDTNYTLLTNLSEGKHYWTVLAADTLGNISDTLSSSFVYDTIIIDSTPPSIDFVYIKSSSPEYLYYNNQTFNQPLNISNKRSENVYINGNHSMNLVLNAAFDDNNPEKIIFGKCYENSDSVYFTSYQDTCYYLSIGTSKGDTQILITVYDKSGLTDTVLIVIKEDKIVTYLPSLELPENLAQEVQFDTYFVWSSDADELSGISYFRVYADTEGTFAAPYSIDTTSFIIRTSDLIQESSLQTGDSVYWKVETFDKVGNSRMSSARSYRVRTDFTPPYYSDEKPENNSMPNNSASIISLKYNDLNGVDTRYVKLYVNSADVTSLSTVTATSISFETSGIYPHGEKVYVMAILGDIYNNTTTVQWSFTPIYKNVSADILKPDDNHNTSTRIINVSGTAGAVKTGNKLLVYLNDVNVNTVSLTADASLNATWSSTVSLTGYGDKIRVSVNDTFGRNAQDTIIVNYFESIGINITSPADNYDTLVGGIIISGTVKGVNSGDSVVLLRNGLNYDVYTFVSHTDTLWAIYTELPSQNVIFTARLNSSLFGQNIASVSITASYIDTPSVEIQSPVNNYDTKSSSLIFSGTTYNTLSNDEAIIYLNGTSVLNWNIDSKNGSWSKTLNLSGKSDVVSIYVTDAFGRTGCDTAIVSYYKIPEIEIKLPSSNSCTTLQSVTVSGTSLYSSVNDTVIIYKNGVVHSNYIITENNGSWSGTVSLSSSNDTILVKITDKFSQSSYDTIFLNYLNITSFSENEIINVYEDLTTQIQVVSTEKISNSIWSVNSGSNISVSVLEGETDYISITPKFDFTGTETLVLTLRYYPDLGNLAEYFVDTVQLSVNVMNTNDTPYFITEMPDTFVNVTKLFWLKVIGTDTDANSMTFSFNGSVPSGMTVNRVDDTSAIIQWTPSSQQVDSYFINIKVSDNYGYYSQKLFKITVNRPTVIISSPNNLDCTTVKEVKISGITVNSSNNDDIKIYKNNVLQSRVKLTADNGEWSGTVSLSSRADSVRVEIINRTTSVLYYADTITLNYLDILNDTVLLTEDSAGIFILSSTESSEYVEWSVLPGKYQTVKIIEGTADYVIDTPCIDCIGYDTLLLTATYFPDSPLRTRSISDSKIINVIIQNVNDKPYFTSSASLKNIEVSMLYTYLITASDTDNDKLTFDFYINLNNASITKISDTSAVLEWTPDKNQVGVQPVSVRVTDINGAYSIQTYNVLVEPRTLPVYNINSPVANNNTLELNWTRTSDTDIVYYYIYSADYDSGIGSIDVAKPLDTVPASVNSITLNNILKTGVEQMITVLPVDKNGITADINDGGFIVVKPELDNNCLVESKINFINGFKVSGDFLKVESFLVKGNVEKMSSIVFEYRKTGDTKWETMAVVSGSNVSNPIKNVKNITENGLSINWNISQFNEGSYQIRTVATDVNNLVEQNPMAIVIYIIKNNQAADYYSYKENGAEVISQTIFAGLAGDNKINIFTESENKIDKSTIVSSVKVSIPGDYVDTGNNQKIVITLLTPEIIETVNSNIKDPFGEKIVGNNIVVLDTIPYNSLVSLNNLIAEGQESRLNKEANVIIDYPDKNNDGWIDNINSPVPVREEWLAVWYRENISEEWKIYNMEKVKFDYEKNTVNISVSHFTMYALFTMSEAMNMNNSIDNVVVYPNPYIPNGANPKQGKPYTSSDPVSGIIFNGINDGTKIEVFTLRGKLVWDAVVDNAAAVNWKCRWNVKNNSGEDVASGWYLYVINKNGNRKTGKIAVIR
ncbi:hypothetical protein KA977_02635 [Candidatus Dependentiae bacterium]|nr:hypothetical protein [Candidatus Dependentiae bacterium]